MLPLTDSATSDPNDRVVGVDFSGGMAGVAAQLNSALGATFLQFSNPAGTTLRVLDDGAGNKLNVDAASARTTVTGLAVRQFRVSVLPRRQPSLHRCVHRGGKQKVGFAGRIVVNPAVLGDPTRLVVYQTSPLTPAGDGTRPNFIYDRLTSAILVFSPRSGIGTEAAPFASSLPAFMRQMISQQGEAAASAESLQRRPEDRRQLAAAALRRRLRASMSTPKWRRF